MQACLLGYEMAAASRGLPVMLRRLWWRRRL